MSSPESQVATEDDELYNFIFELKAEEDKKAETVQVLSSSENTPAHLKTDTEWSHTNVDNAETINTDELKNIQELPVLTENKEEKPWTKVGANITDYFNYGFDEESWRAYCTKQLTLRANLLFVKNMGHTRYEEKASCSATSGSPSVPASRPSSASTDVTGGQSGFSGTVEGWQNLCDGGNNTQVVTEMFPEDKRIASYLPRPSSFNSLFAYTPPPSTFTGYNPTFLYQREPPPPCPVSTLDGGHLEGLDKPSTSLLPYSSGVSLSTSRHVPSGSVTATAKASDGYRQQEMCDNNRDRLRGHDHNKRRSRSKSRGSHSCSSSHDSEEGRMRHRDTVERGYKRHHRFTRRTGEKRRNSSRSRKEGSEDRGRQRRHTR